MTTLIQPITEIIREQDGSWSHPDFGGFTESTSEIAMQQWLSDQEIKQIQLFDLLDQLEIMPAPEAQRLRGIYEQTGNFAEIPLPPSPGPEWFLVSVHPSPEFGPVAMWVTRSDNLEAVGQSAPPRPVLDRDMVAAAAYEVLHPHFSLDQLPVRIDNVVTQFMGSPYTRAIKDLVWAMENTYGWTIDHDSPLRAGLTNFTETVEAQLAKAEAEWGQQVSLQPDLVIGARLELGLLRCTGTVMGIDPYTPNCYLVREDCQRDVLHTIPFESAKVRR